jgi:hypothetical protein
MLRDLRAAWELSIRQLKGLEGPAAPSAALEALHLCALLAAEAVPVEALVRAAWELGPARSSLCRLLFPGRVLWAADVSWWRFLGGVSTQVLRVVGAPMCVDDAMQRMEPVVRTLVRCVLG